MGLGLLGWTCFWGWLPTEAALGACPSSGWWGWKGLWVPGHRAVSRPAGLVFGFVSLLEERK